MKIDDVNKHKMLTAEVGGWLFNGETFCKTVFIPMSNEGEWRDVTNEFKEQWEAEELRKQEEEHYAQ